MDDPVLPRRTYRSPNESFSRLTEIAASRGFALLTRQWHGTRFAYLFRCAAGHEFTRAGLVVMRGTITCLTCVEESMNRRFLEILSERDFVCLEGRYLGQTSRQHFTCGDGHAWMAEARKILEGHGCPRCAAARRAESLTHSDGLERLQQAAAAHGGRCLAGSYIGIRENYLWECADGHQWQARGNNVVNGGWCWKCFARRNGDANRKPERLSDIHAKASSYGGQCLDNTYHGTNARYRFRCAKGHEWSALGNLVLGGSWCMQCANLGKRLTIEQMREVARERGGRCLSQTYVNNRTKLEWECHLGHRWSAAAGTVINRGAWCPNCFRLRVTKNALRRARYDVEG